MSNTKVLMQGKLFQRCTHFLYCSVLSLGGKVNTRRMSQPDMESIFKTGHRKLLYEFSKLNAFILLGYQTNTDASILVYKLHPKRTGFNMYAEYTRPQLTFLALVPWVINTNIPITYIETLDWRNHNIFLLRKRFEYGTLWIGHAPSLHSTVYSHSDFCFCFI